MKIYIKIINYIIFTIINIKITYLKIIKSLNEPADNSVKSFKTIITFNVVFINKLFKIIGENH